MDLCRQIAQDGAFLTSHDNSAVDLVAMHTCKQLVFLWRWRHRWSSISIPFSGARRNRGGGYGVQDLGHVNRAGVGHPDVCCFMRIPITLSI